MTDGIYIPGDYAIDALSLEAERRRKQMGVPRYSYGQLVADTTPAQREQIAEDYLERLKKAHKKGRYRVSGGMAAAKETSMREVEEAVCQKLEAGLENEDKAGQ